MNIQMNVRNQAASQTGGTMIEVLVTVVITAIGLLGLAVLQNTSLKVSYDSYVRTQVAFIGADLADRVRANPADPAVIAAGGTAGTYSLAFGAAAGAAPTDCQDVAAQCTQDDIRAYDLFYWRQNAVNLLPNSDVSVSLTGNVYTVEVTWEDRTVNDDVAGDDADFKTYQYFFRI